MTLIKCVVLVFRESQCTELTKEKVYSETFVVSCNVVYAVDGKMAALDFLLHDVIFVVLM